MTGTLGPPHTGMGRHVPPPGAHNGNNSLAYIVSRENHLFLKFVDFTISKFHGLGPGLTGCRSRKGPQNSLQNKPNLKGFTL